MAERMLKIRVLYGQVSPGTKYYTLVKLRRCENTRTYRALVTVYIKNVNASLASCTGVTFGCTFAVRPRRAKSYAQRFPHPDI